MSEEILVIKERLDRLESRFDLNDKFRHEIRGEQKKVELEQAIIRTELKNISKDIEDVSKQVEARLSSINRALWAGFTVFLTAFLTVLGFIISQGGP